MVLVFLVACTDEVTEIPFSEEKTVKILADMYIIEARLSGKQNNESDSLRKHFQQILMDDYTIDSTDLIMLSEYLEANPEHSQELHDQARSRIDHLQRTVN